MSTAMWRLRPLTFLAASQPREALGTVGAARTDCESITAAVGSAARPLLFNLHRARRRVRRAWADAVYAGKLQPWAAAYLHLTVEIVKRPEGQHTFQVLPRRWVVERTLAWITSYRRCARDYERLPAHHEAAVYWAMITLMTRRLARSGSAPIEEGGSRAGRNAP